MNGEVDYMEEVEGIQVIVEKELLEKFNRFTIDYSDRWFRKGFIIVPGVGVGGSPC